MHFLGKNYAKVITLNSKTLQFELKQEFLIEGILNTGSESEYIQNKSYWHDFNTLFFQTQNIEDKSVSSIGLINFNLQRYHIEYAKGQELGLSPEMYSFSLYNSMYSPTKIIYLDSKKN